MRLINSSYNIIEQTDFTLEGILKHIELCGRVCYKSEHKITEDSYKSFVDMLIKRGHLAVLEQGTIYLKGECDGELGDCVQIYNLQNNPYTKIIQKGYDLYITTNYRVILTLTNNSVHNSYNDPTICLKYLCEPTEFHAKRTTVKFICDRGILQEFRTHRVFGRDDDDNWLCDVIDPSACAESTRYCNYSKDKFDSEITYIAPCWLNFDKIQELTRLANEDNKEVYKMGHDKNLSMEERGLCSFIYDMSNHEHGYFFQLQCGWSPQQARAVLPNTLKTELIMTGFDKDWEGFFKLRCANSAHPDARKLAVPLKEEFIKLGKVKDYELSKNTSM